jgi:hypothetical protein
MFKQYTDLVVLVNLTNGNTILELNISTAGYGIGTSNISLVQVSPTDGSLYYNGNNGTIIKVNTSGSITTVLSSVSTDWWSFIIDFDNMYLYTVTNYLRKYSFPNMSLVSSRLLASNAYSDGVPVLNNDGTQIILFLGADDDRRYSTTGSMNLLSSISFGSIAFNTRTKVTISNYIFKALSIASTIYKYDFSGNLILSVSATLSSNAIALDDTYVYAFTSNGVVLYRQSDLVQTMSINIRNLHGGFIGRTISFKNGYIYVSYSSSGNIAGWLCKISTDGFIVYDRQVPAAPSGTFTGHAT